MYDETAKKNTRSGKVGKRFDELA